MRVSAVFATTIAALGACSSSDRVCIEPGADVQGNCVAHVDTADKLEPLAPGVTLSDAAQLYIVGEFRVVGADVVIDIDIENGDALVNQGGVADRTVGDGHTTASYTKNIDAPATCPELNDPYNYHGQCEGTSTGGDATSGTVHCLRALDNIDCRFSAMRFTGMPGEYEGWIHAPLRVR